jgi:hypothetical protein
MFTATEMGMYTNGTKKDSGKVKITSKEQKLQQAEMFNKDRTGNRQNRLFLNPHTRLQFQNNSSSS